VPYGVTSGQHAYASDQFDNAVTPSAGTRRMKGSLLECLSAPEVGRGASAIFTDGFGNGNRLTGLNGAHTGNP